MSSQWVDRWCHRCGNQVSKWRGKVYDINMIEETHLCADCVIDLIRTDPSPVCVNIMKYITINEVPDEREGDNA